MDDIKHLVHDDGEYNKAEQWKKENPEEYKELEKKYNQLYGEYNSENS